MSPIHQLLLGILFTALIGGTGWIIAAFYKAFTDLINKVAGAVLKLETTITKMDERFNAQTIVCGMHREAISQQHTEVINEIGRVDERVDKVEKKIDDHVNNSSTRKRRA